jgi:hypothetical protein
VILAITVGIIHGIGIDTSSSNNWSLSVVVAFATACWVVLAIPWFFLEQSRPGQQIPAGMNIVSVGIRQLGYAMREILKLQQTFIYLVGYNPDAEAGDTGAGTGTARLTGTADGDSTSTDDLDLRGPGRLERECWSRWIREGRRGAVPRGVRSAQLVDHWTVFSEFGLN